MGPDNPAQEGARGRVKTPEKPPVIVGIGASAGGVRALQQFFDTLPGRVEAAFVVVVHLDPDTHSELASILAAKTDMPVTQVVIDHMRDEQVVLLIRFGTNEPLPA